MLQFNFALLSIIFVINLLNNVNGFGMAQPLIKLISAKKCAVEGEWTDLDLNVYSIGEKQLAIDAVWTPDRTINNEYSYIIDVDKWSGSDWQKGIYQQEGLLCEDLNEILPKSWPKVAAAADPPLPQECPIEPGTYTFKAFELDNDSANIPGAAALQGRLQLTSHIYDENQVEICCLETVVDITLM